MTDYALFHNGKQISKAHSTHAAATMECYDHGVAVRWAPDFPGDRYRVTLADGYEVKPVEDKPS